VLVVDGKVVAVAERVPAHVVGDGKSTIEELIEQTNLDPWDNDALTRIEVDRTSYQLLSGKGTLSTVPPGKYVTAGNCNLSTGGIARPHRRYPSGNVWLAERAAKIIGLDIAGMSHQILAAPCERDGVIVEVNAAPGCTSAPAGVFSYVAGAVLNMLFPDSPSRIPSLL